MKFVGIDLGWKTDPPKQKGTAVSVMDKDGNVLLADLVTNDDPILEYLKGGSYLGGRGCTVDRQ
jgi:predicted RNase H-like nuclease